MSDLRKLINVITENISDDWFKDGGFQTYKKPTKERYEIASEPGVIQTLEGPVEYAAGDYIMTGPKGEQYPISKQKFSSLKDDLGNGVCQPKKIIKMAKLADHDGFVTVDWGNGPQKLNYSTGKDYIVRHGTNDYGVVKQDIFDITYERV